MRVLIAGDTHGNTGWFRSYLFPVAMVTQADAVIVVGDFGAWEHMPAGVRFMDDVDSLAARAGVTLYWLHGNHDKWSHTVAKYGMEDGINDFFISCRENVFYIPQGLSWNWLGTRFRSFGGAYSIDRSWRLKAEREEYNRLLREARHKVDTVLSQEGTLWFPEEEMTDSEMEDLLRVDSGQKDIVLSHDKPLSAKPDWDRKDLPRCVPNQLRLERALRAHKPRWWIHGHLHHHYMDTLSGPDWQTTVIGLDPDNKAAESQNWKRENTWVQVDLNYGRPPKLILGRTVAPTPEDLGEARRRLIAP